MRTLCLYPSGSPTTAFFLSTHFFFEPIIFPNFQLLVFVFIYTFQLPIVSFSFVSFADRSDLDTDFTFISYNVSNFYVPCTLVSASFLFSRLLRFQFGLSLFFIFFRFQSVCRACLISLRFARSLFFCFAFFLLDRSFNVQNVAIYWKEKKNPSIHQIPLRFCPGSIFYLDCGVTVFCTSANL